MTENPYDPQYDRENDIKYKDKLGINYNFDRHLDRCLRLVGYPGYADAVEALAILLPPASQDALSTRSGEWCPTVEKFEFEWVGPIKMGTKTKPLMHKMGDYSGKRYPIPYVEDEDGKKVIDWTSPHIRSPQLVEKEAPDHTLYFKLIMDEAHLGGLTWPTDTYTEIGFVKPIKPRKNPTRMPTE